MGLNGFTITGAIAFGYCIWTQHYIYAMIFGGIVVAYNFAKDMNILTKDETKETIEERVEGKKIQYKINGETIEYKKHNGGNALW